MSKLFKKVLSYLIIFTVALTTILPSPSAIAASTRPSTDTMAIGSYVQFGSYYGKPILWRVIHKDAYGTMVFMDKIISIKPFDSAEPTNSDIGRQTRGSNNWSNSNLREWLNSNASTVIYSTQKPDAAHVWNSYNPYDTEAGFLSNFTTNEQNAIVQVTHKYMITSVDAALKDGGSGYHTYNSINPLAAIQNYDVASYKYTVDKVFPLSVKELNDYVYSNAALGDGASYYMAKPTADVFSHTTYTCSIPLFDLSSNWIYWLRDAYTGDSTVVRRVWTSGDIAYSRAYDSPYGVRGALYLKPNLTTSGGTGTSVNPYTFFGVTAIASPLLDQYNNGDASDIRVIFNGTSDEGYVKEYRIMAVRTAVASAFDTAAALALPSGRYDVQAPKGKNRQHLFNLTQSLQDSEGNGITGGTSYTIFVLTVGKTGCSNTLTSLGTITLNTNNQGAKVEAATPLVMDVANNNNGTDLRVTFKKSKNEANIQEYRIIASTANLDLTAANSLVAIRYKAIAPSNPRTNYVATLDAVQKDQTGADIQNGTPYNAYVLAVGKNGYANVLSTASKSIMLSAYVPGAPTIRGLRALYVGEGSDSSNIKVTFYEPTANSSVDEYRIFLVPVASILDEATAESAASGRYQAVSPTRRGALHSITLDAGLRDYNGNAVSAGTYKVYVLTVGKNGNSSRLSGASTGVTLE